MFKFLGFNWHLIPVYQILCYFYSYTQSKKECKFNLGGLKKQNRLWHCHANNKTGWHVDSFKLVGVHIILLMYILNVMHRPFFAQFLGFQWVVARNIKNLTGTKDSQFFGILCFVFPVLARKNYQAVIFSNPMLQKHKKRFT